MTTETETVLPRGFSTAGEAFTVTLTFPERFVNVAVGKGSTLTNGFDLSKFTPELIAFAAVNGFAKALADTSDKSLTPDGLHGLRQKRVATWEAGDWAGRGGGVPNPLVSTMREVAVDRIHKAIGGARSEAEKRVKGKLVDWMRDIQLQKHPGSDTDVLDHAVTAAMANLEAEARKLIAKREAAKAKVVAPESLSDLF